MALCTHIGKFPAGSILNEPSDVIFNSHVITGLGYFAAADLIDEDLDFRTLLEHRKYRLCNASDTIELTGARYALYTLGIHAPVNISGIEAVDELVLVLIRNELNGIHLMLINI